MPNYGPPQIDLSGFNPIGSYEQGAELRRSYQLRNALSKLAPDDFQGMARALMQFGDPKEGVQAMQLQATLGHQAFQEDLATKQLEATIENSRILNEARKTRSDIGLENAQAPFNAVRSSLQAYKDARGALLGPGAAGFGESVTSGPAIGAVRTLAASVAEGRRLRGKAADAYVNDVVPGWQDFTLGRAAAKLARLEHDAAALGLSGEALGAGSATEYVLPPYEAPPRPPPSSAGTRAGAAGGREVQPHVVQTVPIPGIGAGESAQARETGGVPAAAKDRVPDKLYTMPNGQKAFWRVFPNGQMGWEPAD
jgi:hypothetical protein